MAPARSTKSLLLSVGVLAAVMWGSPAHAQDADSGNQESEETAQAHFRVGRSYYDTGRFAEAAREFQRAYDLSQRPMLLYNVFVAHRDAGNLQEATATLRLYLELVPDAAERDQLTARLATMERLIAQQGGSADTSDPSGTSEPERTASRDAGSASRGGGGMWTPGWIIAGVGAAAAVASIITGAMALGARSELNDICDPSGECPSGFEATRDEAATLAGVTDGLLFGGLALAVTGVVLAVVLSDDGGTETRAACGPAGCNVRVRF